MYYRYYGASLAEIDPLQVIREAFQLIYSMNLHLPTRYLLLDRALATLGSVGVELYPDFNVFEVARSFQLTNLVRYGAADLFAGGHSRGGNRVGPFETHSYSSQVRAAGAAKLGRLAFF